MGDGARTELFGKWQQGSMVISDMGRGFGRRWFVDPTNAKAGATAGYGASPDSPFSTMTACVAAAVAAAAAVTGGPGDIIYVNAPLNANALNEAVVIPSSLHGLRILGVGSNPDGAVWTAAADATCLTVNAYNVTVENFKFRPPIYTAGTPAAIKLSGAYQARIRRCLFQGQTPTTGSFYGIHSDGNNANVHVEDCTFQYLNNVTGISAVAIGSTGYSAGENSGWQIHRCHFHSNANHILMRMRQGLITGCFFAEHGLGADGAELHAHEKLRIDGAAGGWNHVHGNFFEGAYTNTGGYYAGTNDNWAGNWTEQTAGTYTNGAGMTLTVPQVA